MLNENIWVKVIKFFKGQLKFSWTKFLQTLSLILSMFSGGPNKIFMSLRGEIDGVSFLL